MSKKQKIIIISVLSFTVLFLTAMVIIVLSLNNSSPVVQPEIETKATATNPPPPTQVNAQSIEIEEESYDIMVGEKQKLTPTIIPSGAIETQFFFSSSNVNIATVNSDGEVSGITDGECVITVELRENEDIKAEYKIKVIDENIEKINILNDYLNGIDNRDIVPYHINTLGVVYIENCKIADINEDESYELIIDYNIKANQNVIEVVSLEGNNAQSVKTFDDFQEVLEKGYSKLTQEVYKDNGGKIYLKSQAITSSETITTTEIMFYEVKGDDLILLKKYKDIYNYTVGSKVPDSGEFYINDIRATESEYISSVNNYFEGYILFDDYASRYVELEESAFEKMDIVVDLPQQYLNRISWKSSDEKVATVNSSGVVSALQIGRSDIIADLSCFTSPISNVYADVSNISADFENYLNDESNQTVKSNGKTLPLYGSKVIDVDNDAQKELILYYTDSKNVRIDIVSLSGSSIKSNIALEKNAGTYNSLICEIYMDNAKNQIVIQEKYIKGNSLEFYFDEFVDETLTKYTPVYKVDFVGDTPSVYYINGNERKESDFTIQVNHYGQYTNWEKQ